MNPHLARKIDHWPLRAVAFSALPGRPLIATGATLRQLLHLERARARSEPNNELLRRLNR